MKAIDDLARLSLVNNLKTKIQDLKREVEHQKSIIQGYKRSTKTTLINEQEIEIQKLNDENKRLLLIIEDLRSQFPKQNKGLKGMRNVLRMSNAQVYPSSNFPKKKQTYQQSQPSEQNQRATRKQTKKPDFQTKYYDLLRQNQKIRKQLVILKANDTVQKNRKPRSSILMESNINQMDKVKLRCYQLEAQLASCLDRSAEFKGRVVQLEGLLEEALSINRSMRLI